MSRLRRGLGTLVLLCLAVRLSHWLLAPVLPWLIVLFLLVLVLSVSSYDHHKDL